MKYYIRFGKYKHIILAGNPHHACIQLFKKYMDNEPKTLPLAFIVSQKGFDDHDDDLVIGTGELIMLLQLANKAIKN